MPPHLRVRFLNYICFAHAHGFTPVARLSVTAFASIKFRGLMHPGSPTVFHFLALFADFACGFFCGLTSAIQHGFRLASQYPSRTKRPTGTIIGRRTAVQIGFPAIGGGQDGPRTSGSKGLSTFRDFGKLPPPRSPESSALRNYEFRITHYELASASQVRGNRVGDAVVNLRALFVVAVEEGDAEAFQVGRETGQRRNANSL